MTPPSREEAVEEIRRRTDLAGVVGRFVKLKRSGRNFTGLCPFHAEKTPSFTVSPAKGFFHCFGCKASGDVFTFLMKMEGKTFPEVLEELAAAAGVELPRGGAQPQQRGQRTRLLEINEKAAAFYENLLWNSAEAQPARRLLEGRALAPETSRRFRLGYAPAGWNNLSDCLANAGVALSDAVELGLVIEGSRGPYDMFRQRLVFPIQDIQGRVLGFGARRLDDAEQGPKYINSRQGPLYDKSEVFYGLAQAREAIRRQETAVLVEGYFDVIGPHAAGVQNVIATCGTALTERHAAVLRRLAEQVICVFDGDTAGWSATEKSARLLLQADISPRAAALPAGEDPDSFVRHRGGEAFSALLKTARPSLEVLADHLLESGDDAESRRRAARRLVPLLAECRDPIRQGVLKKWLSDRLALDEEALGRALRQETKEARGEVPRASPPPASQAAGGSAADPNPAGLEQLLGWSLLAPRLASSLREDDLLGQLAPGPARKLLEILIEKGDRSQPAGLLADIEDADLRRRLGEMLLKNEALSPEQVEMEWRRSRMQVRVGLLRARRQEITYRISRAEKEGRNQDTNRLIQDKMALDRQLVALERESRSQ